MQTDPNATHHFTTAAVPEWAEVATGDARDAEIARLRRTIAILEAMNDKFERTREIDLRVLNSRDDEIASLKAELADVKAECCRLVCRNGDLEAENERLRGAALSVTRSGVVDGGKVVIASYWFDRLVQALAKEPQ